MLMLTVCVNVSALKIHMSQNAHEAVMAFPEFITECRGDIYVKVKNVTIPFEITFICTLSEKAPLTIFNLI